MPPLLFYQSKLSVKTRTIMNIEKRVRELVEEKITAEGRSDLFIVDIKMQANGNLIILVDGDSGIGIDDIVSISRHVGFHLEEENLIETAYNLEVSSPGIDAPLTLIRQYLKNIGRSLSIKITDGTKREGKLTGITEDAILIDEKIKEKGKRAAVIETVVPINQIAETKVLISFK